MGRAAPGISGRKFAKILTRRGCEVIRQTGGHLQWKAPSGAPITTVAVGRDHGPSFREVAQAAKALDTTIEELLYR